MALSIIRKVKNIFKLVSLKNENNWYFDVSDSQTKYYFEWQPKQRQVLRHRVYRKYKIISHFYYYDTPFTKEQCINKFIKAYKNNKLIDNKTCIITKILRNNKSK